MLMKLKPRKQKVVKSLQMKIRKVYLQQCQVFGGLDRAFFKEVDKITLNKEFRFKWRPRSNLEAGGGRAVPGKRVCISLKLSGQMP